MVLVVEAKGTERSPETLGSLGVGVDLGEGLLVVELAQDLQRLLTRGVVAVKQLQ